MAVQFVEGQTVGIDLGAAFSAVAQIDAEGDPCPILNGNDDMETSSVVLLGDGGRIVVGLSRGQAASEDPDRVIDCVKRHLGESDFQKTLDGKPITPEFVAGIILKKLCQDAGKRIGKIGNVVISVPAYFNDARRKATQDAGRIAGVNVVDIINEPTAAALTYAWLRDELGAGGKPGDRPRTILVYDLGAGKFDATLVRYTPTRFRVLATDGDVKLGGVDWTDRLANYAAGEFKKEHGGDPRESAASLHVLRAECESAKIELSKKPEATIACRHGGKTSRVSVTVRHFERLTAELLQRTADKTAAAMKQGKISSAELDAVVLVGGSTLMPQVPRMLQQLTGKAPSPEISLHTAVAQGAAIHAAMLAAVHRGETSGLSEKVRRRLKPVKVENVNSHGLGVVAKNPKDGQDVNHVMIPRNSTLPVEVKKAFKTNSVGQSRVTVQVIEGDSPDPRAGSLVGKCRITGLPPGLPAGSPIEVTYAFDASGRISVSAQEKTSGAQATTEIERAGGLSEAQIEAFAKLAGELTVE